MVSMQLCGIGSRRLTEKLTAFCHENGVSENVVFLTAYNYCISLFSNEKDTVSTSIHSGRTDSRWNRLAGPLFRTYYFRYTENKEETVAEMLKRSGRQIMETMRCYMSNLHADEMFFQYQGDILNINTIGGYPAERQRISWIPCPSICRYFLMTRDIIMSCATGKTGLIDSSCRYL